MTTSSIGFSGVAARSKRLCRRITKIPRPNIIWPKAKIKEYDKVRRRPIGSLVITVPHTRHGRAECKSLALSLAARLAAQQPDKNVERQSRYAIEVKAAQECSRSARLGTRRLN